MKVICRIAILTAVALIVVASVQPVSAACSDARLIGGCGGGGCKYFVLPGPDQTIPSAAITGNFWALGAGDPAAGNGHDNGLATARNNALSSDWLQPFGPGYYLAGSWANNGVDGCADNGAVPQPRRTVAAISDAASNSPGGLQGYFAVACQEADAGSNYDFSTGSTEFIMAPIPYPAVSAQPTVNAGVVTIPVNGPAASVNGPAALAAGTYALAPSCSAGPALIRGYKLYTQVRPTGSPVTDLSRTAGWTADPGGERALGAPATVTAPCSGTTQVYVATTLVFNSGFETAFVSKPTQVSCDPNLSTRPGDFRKIQKPTRQSPRRRQQ